MAPGKRLRFGGAGVGGCNVGFLAFAGHAGDMDHPGAPVVLPFEIWLAVMGIALLLLLAIAWLIGIAFRLTKIDRRLRVLEGKKKE